MINQAGRLKLTLTQDQADALSFALESPYSIIALKMGMGKSLVAIALKNKIKNSCCLIVCPAGLIHNWKKEIEKSLDGQIITVFKKGSDVYPVWDADFVIISYDLAIRFKQLFCWASMVIFDEANYLSSMNTKRTSIIHKLVYECSVPRLHLLTGTPIKNRVEEYYSLISLCNYDPRKKTSDFLKEFPESVSFADYFSHRREFTKQMGHRFFTIKKWEGVRREDELKKKWLNPIYFARASTSEKPIRKEVFLADFNDQKLLEEFNKFKESAGKSVLSTVKAGVALKKAPLTVKYVQDLFNLGEIDSVVIFTDHVDSAKFMARAFNVAPVTGEMSPIYRQEIANNFQQGQTKVIVATIRSFSTGHTLTRACNMVFNDYPWVPGDIDQAEHRIMRIGQTRQCVIHRILGSEQDSYILKTIESKRSVISAVT